MRGRAELQDAGDSEERWLMGTGCKVPRDQQVSVHRFVASNMAAGHMEVPQSSRAAYMDDTTNCKNITLFQQADLPGIGTVSTRSYARAITRVSYFVLAEVLSGRRGQQACDYHIVEVHAMMRVSDVPEQAEQEGGLLPCLRVARCTVYAKQPALCDGEVLVIRLDQVKHVERAIPLFCIAHVLISAHPQFGAGKYYGDDEDKVFFALSSSCSRSR